DLYMASMGRSGSTLIANWLTIPGKQVVLLEPEFPKGLRHRSLMRQCESLGFPVSEAEWSEQDACAAARIGRILGPRLSRLRWGVKEVQCAYHRGILKDYAPARVLVTVRNIRNVFLSFVDKHRRQGNEEQYSVTWTRDYCQREAAGLVQFVTELAKNNIPHMVVRYEDFIFDAAVRKGIETFTGWTGGGDLDRNFEFFNRVYERDMHRGALSTQERDETQRLVTDIELAKADELAKQCSEYQTAFSYA
ncbi:MAG TPA: hypothetical protein VL625_09395, partial [Patescibacteria group bacterium]|nr:hypothetical protein [Patescibacteria group bacterium]